MTPAARLQAAIDILDGLQGTNEPADRFIKSWFRERRFAGSGDRRDIGELVFRVLRQRYSFAHRMGEGSPRSLVIAALLADGKDVDALFTGGYGPAPLSEAEQAILAAAPAEAPAFVRGEFPAWLEGELTRRFGASLPDEMAAFAQRAPVDLRVNTLKAARDDVLARLQQDGFACEAVGAMGIRCPPGSNNLNKHPLFESGAFEIQDLASQIGGGAGRGKAGDASAGLGGRSRRQIAGAGGGDAGSRRDHRL